MNLKPSSAIIITLNTYNTSATLTHRFWGTLEWFRIRNVEHGIYLIRLQIPNIIAFLALLPNNLLSGKLLTNKLSKQTVLHLAQLVKMSISEKEVKSLQGQLSVILDNFQLLNEVDTEGVSPTDHATDINTIMREDIPKNSLSTEDALSNAPLKEEYFFRVKDVLGQSWLSGLQHFRQTISRWFRFSRLLHIKKLIGFNLKYLRIR